MPTNTNIINEKIIVLISMSVLIYPLKNDSSSPT